MLFRSLYIVFLFYFSVFSALPLNQEDVFVLHDISLYLFHIRVSNFLFKEILTSFYVKLIIFIMSVQIRIFRKISVSVLFSLLISFTPYITLHLPFFMFALHEFSLSLFISLFIYLFIYLLIYLFIYLFTYLFIYLYISFFSYLFIFFSFFRQLSSLAPFTFSYISLYLLLNSYIPNIFLLPIIRRS